MSKQIVYFDMDGVLVDLAKKIATYPKEIVAGFEAIDAIEQLPDLFSGAVPIKGAIEAFNKLCESNKYDCYILSTAPWDAPWVWMQKREWVEKYIGKNAYKRLILSHNKHLNIGDYLIDDRTKNGAGEFTGELIQFGTEAYPDWDAVLNYLKP